MAMPLLQLSPTESYRNIVLVSLTIIVNVFCRKREIRWHDLRFSPWLRYSFVAYAAVAPTRGVNDARGNGVLVGPGRVRLVKCALCEAVYARVEVKNQSVIVIHVLSIRFKFWVRSVLPNLDIVEVVPMRINKS